MPAVCGENTMDPVIFLRNIYKNQKDKAFYPQINANKNLKTFVSEKRKEREKSFLRF